MKRYLIIVLFLTLILNIYSEGIYIAECSTSGSIYLINEKGMEFEGPIETYGGSAENWRFDQGDIAILRFKDKSYNALQINGEYVYSSTNRLMPASNDRLWELIDEKAKKWRLIDLDGIELYSTTTVNQITPSHFYNNFCVVNSKGMNEIIDINGNIITKTEYFLGQTDAGVNIPLINDNYYVGRSDERDWKLFHFYTSLVDMNGEAAFEPMLMSYPRPYNDGWFFAFVDERGGHLLNKNGESLFGDFGLSHASWFVDGLCPVLFPGEERKKFIDTEGNVVLDGYEIGFYDANPFNEGMACVGVNPPRYRNKMIRNLEHYGSDGGNLWGAIDRDGNWVIEPKFPKSFWFNRGLATIRFKFVSRSDSLKENGTAPGQRNIIINQKGEIVWDSFPHDIEVLKKYKEELLEVEFSIDHLELNTLEKINEYIMAE